MNNRKYDLIGAVIMALVLILLLTFAPKTSLANDNLGTINNSNPERDKKIEAVCGKIQGFLEKQWCETKEFQRLGWLETKEQFKKTSDTITVWYNAIESKINDK